MQGQDMMSYDLAGDWQDTGKKGKEREERA